jgi:hypothetical protein
MVFSINAVDTGPNNFTAFQALAKQINGTQANGTQAGSAATPSSSKNGAAFSSPAISAYITFAALGLIRTLL